MTNTHDVVIPRSELPKVELSGFNFVGIAGRIFGVNASSAASAHEIARIHLAAAEAIDKDLADKAKAEDERKLDAEGLILHNALHSQNAAEWEANSYAKKYWRNVARAARELYGK